MTNTARPFMPVAMAVLLMLFCDIALADKTDVVVLINGNDVTGEIKSLNFALLSYSTDSMGTVSIDWEDIVSLTSNQSLQVELASGTRYFGTLVPASGPDLIAIAEGTAIRELEKSTVVRIVPVETDDKLWQRLEGSISFGLTAGKSSEVTQSNLDANIRYRARKYLVGLDVSSTITDQPGAETTQRQRLSTNYQRFRENRWFSDWTAIVEKNDELGINSRYSLGGGLGRYFIQTNKNQLSWLGGLFATRETFAGSDPSETNVEGNISINYLHRTPEPSSNIVWSLDYYPVIDDLSSYRAESNLSFRREFVDDLFFDLSLYYSYLSAPPMDAENDDYGVTTSLGYSF